MKLVIILSTFFLFLTGIVTGQSVTRYEFLNAGAPSGQARMLLPSEFIKDGNRIYTTIGLKEEHISTLPDIGVDLEHGDGVYFLEYEPGKGYVDYTCIKGFSFASNLNVSFDNDRMAFGGFVRNVTIDDLVLFEDEIRRSNDIIVYDKHQDSVLYHYVDDVIRLNDSAYYSIYNMSFELKDEHLYISTTYEHDITFLGDTLLRPNDTVFWQFTTVLHKMNWQTNELVWKREIYAGSNAERVREIKVVDDGNIMMAMEVNSPLRFEGELIDPVNYVNSGINTWDSNHNLAILKISPEGEYINHVHFNNTNDLTFRWHEIEDNGNVYAHGVMRWGIELVFEGDTIKNSLSSLTGIAFAFDADLEYRWHKLYNGDRSTVTYSTNEVAHNNVITTFTIHGSVVLEDSTFYSDYYEQYNPENEYQFQSLIVQYDKHGNLLGAPIPFGNKQRITDVISIGEDDYLIFSRGETYSLQFGERPLFFDSPLTLEPDNLVAEEYMVIFEVEDLKFGELSTAVDIVNRNDLIVFPNPVSIGQDLHIRLPNDFQNKDFEISIFDVSGNKIYSNELDLSIGTECIINSSEMTNKGVYLLFLNSENNIYTTTIYYQD